MITVIRDPRVRLAFISLGFVDLDTRGQDYMAAFSEPNKINFVIKNENVALPFAVAFKRQLAADESGLAVCLGVVVKRRAAFVISACNIG